ncbi:uncharacterized protein A1O9_04662 [Exophiala aquamarina CBS 119918]|uniref:Ribosomal protein S21 n=1 Tax=Exophiala aquamarina CBS 119918 TaxID=1182545 RepID=A0A072PIA3_9EURO|nr:uncharacterized protein A1O9_04662 [Exophiala aquamarina CBS 119918]KEF59814.1 hypothetical protein A1O9_04662 [Exophiala aquamarina CBS 119918]
MEPSQALQRCTRFVLQHSTRRSLPTLTFPTLRPELQCTNSKPSSQKSFSSSSRQNNSELSSISALLRDFKKDLRSAQPADERLDSLMGNNNYQRARNPSNLDAFEGTLGTSSRNNQTQQANATMNSFAAVVNRDEIDPFMHTNLRLKPSLGRTVKVVSGDPSRAFRVLESKCAANKVRLDEVAQRFHVRRGQRKKLLRMKRWRALFREGFIAECDKIRRMRKQGW